MCIQTRDRIEPRGLAPLRSAPSPTLPPFPFLFLSSQQRNQPKSPSLGDTPNNQSARPPTASPHSTMDALTLYVPPVLIPLVDALRTQTQLLGISLLSLGAAYLGYIFVLKGRKEAAVAFNVPLPAEVRANWPGRSWEDAQGEERVVLEGQVRGVSFLSNLPSYELCAVYYRHETDYF